MRCRRVTSTCRPAPNTSKRDHKRTPPIKVASPAMISACCSSWGSEKPGCSSFTVRCTSSGKLTPTMLTSTKAKAPRNKIPRCGRR